VIIEILVDEEFFRFWKGDIKSVPDTIGQALIDKGSARQVEEPEHGVDHNAHNALKDARRKDGPKK
jgi:hypothetical protein